MAKVGSAWSDRGHLGNQTIKGIRSERWPLLGRMPWISDAQFGGAGDVFFCSMKNRSISRLASGPRGSV